MAKEVKLLIKLQAPAGQANPASLGSTLGPAGINIMEFCKAFNAHTQKVDAGTPIPAEVMVYADRSFDFITKQPPVSFFIKKMAKISKGSSTTGRTTVGKITMEDIKKIAELKKPDLNSRSIEAACSMIKGSAISMGLEIEG